MILQKLLCFTLAVISGICLLGCEKERPKLAQTETIKIGVIYPFTGPNASTGEDLKAGVELATEIINRSFDIPIPLAKEEGLSFHGGAEIQIIYKDSQSDPNQAAERVEELVKEDQVTAIIGCYSSTVTAAASERAEIMKVPFLNAASTSPTLTQRGFKWFFRTTPDDEIFAQNFFTFLSDLSERMKIEVPKGLILVYENRLWGTSVSRAERKLAIKHGYEIVEDIPYDSKESSFDQDLRRIKLSSPGVILQASYASDAVLFVKGYKAFKINPIAILAMNAGFISPYFLKTLGSDGEYILSREVWALDLGRKKPLVNTINDLFKRRFGGNMTGNSARVFTGLIALADAINRAHSLEAKKVREALLDTDIKGEQLIMPWDGVKFDPETGQNILGKGIIVQVQEGQYRTVWPWDLSSRAVIWPMPSWSERGARK